MNEDTLPKWLYNRFRELYIDMGLDWEYLPDDEWAYWERHAAAVRAAVRGES